MSTPFLRDPEVLHTYSMCPCQALRMNGFLFIYFIFGHKLGFVNLGYLGLQESHIFSGKKNKNVKDSAGVH